MTRSSKATLLRMKVKLILFQLTFFLLSQETQAGIVEGSYKGTETWKYLARFVFDKNSEEEERGKLEAEIRYPAGSKNLALMLYYKSGEEKSVEKEFGIWEEAYNEPLTCEERYKVSIGYADVEASGRVFPLSPEPEEDVVEDGVTYHTSRIVATVVTSRPRWVFITIGSCKATCSRGEICSSSLDVSYKIRMTNGDDVKKMYFGADRNWSYEMATAFIIVYSVVLMPYSFWVRHKLKQVKKYHVTAWLLFLSVWMTFFYLVCNLIHVNSYANSGVGVPSVETLGNFVFTISEFTLLLMAIFVAKGWTITRRKISAMGRVRIAAYMTTYVCFNWLAIAYAKYFLDPAAIVYLYGTPPGYVLIFLRCVAFVWLSYATHTSLKKYASKKRFFRKFWLFISAWILSMPILVTLNSWIDFWYRAKFIFLMTMVIQTITQLVLMLMYDPKPLCSKINSSFPFHAHTSEMLGSRKGNGSTDPNNTFTDANLKRAFIISSKIRNSVVMLQSYTVDLHTFLDESQSRSKQYTLLQKDDKMPHDIENPESNVQENTKPEETPASSRSEEDRTKVVKSDERKSAGNEKTSDSQINESINEKEDEDDEKPKVPVKYFDAEDSPLPKLPKRKKKRRKPKKSVEENNQAPNRATATMENNQTEVDEASTEVEKNNTSFRTT